MPKSFSIETILCLPGMKRWKIVLNKKYLNVGYMPKFHRKRHIEGIENSVENDRSGNEKFNRKTTYMGGQIPPKTTYVTNCLCS